MLRTIVLEAKADAATKRYVSDDKPTLGLESGWEETVFTYNVITKGRE